MGRFGYLFNQTLRKIRYHRKKYFLYIIAFYIGLLLPALCLSNYRCVEQIIGLTTFDQMKDSVIIDWFTDDFDAVAIDSSLNYSVTAHYEERILGDESRYLSITGIDKNRFLSFPRTEGEQFSINDYDRGNPVGIMSRKDSDALSLGVGDYITISNTQIKIVGVINSDRYDGILLPLNTMKKIYSGKDTVQLTATIISDELVSKDDILSEITNEIDAAKGKVSLISASDGKDVYETAINDGKRWRLVRYAIAAVALAFFFVNESLVILGKVEIERRTYGIMIALGAHKKDILAEVILETAVIVFSSALIVVLTIKPLAMIAGIEEAIVVDRLFVADFLILSTIACMALTVIVFRSFSWDDINDLLGVKE